jgi:nitrite reductase/ring-hydroxylating ferredoxin subunit
MDKVAVSVGWVVEEPWRATALAAAGVALLLWLKERMTCAEPFGRHAFKQGRLEAGSVKRLQLDRLRAERGHFPKPFPDGWYKFCESSELSAGQVVSVAALGREFVAFRGEDGKAGVCDAFCPHLGTHLGHGGRVHGNKLVCPYHLWEFNAEGKVGVTRVLFAAVAFIF